MSSSGPAARQATPTVEPLGTVGVERPLLMGKLAIPAVRPSAVSRPRLLRILEQATSPLTVVVAPAGWGKTTLLAQWARHVHRDEYLGWVTLDRTDTDPTRFWTYLLTGLRDAGSKVGESALAALRMPGLDPIESVIPNLLNDLAQQDRRHVLVLDDFHYVTEQSIGEALEFLLTYLPPNCRLVISTRFDPPLPLARWRARGILTEIRADHLRFNLEEAQGLVSDVAEVELDHNQIAGLVDRTEGWAAALHLAALTVRGSADRGRQALLIHGDDRNVIDYLSSEVLASVDDRQRDFLLRSSVLERMSGPLCDVALGITGSAETLEELERANLFVVPLDDQRRWYRYHALIRDALRRELERLGDPDTGHVLRRAAGWFLDQGDIEHTVRHLIAAGDDDRAAQLLLEHENGFLDRGTIGVFLELADSLGSDAARRFPRLGIAMAWAAGLSGHQDRVLSLLDMAEGAASGDEPITDFRTQAGATATVRVLFAYQRPEEVTAALAEARKAVELEDDPEMPGYPVARLALATVLSRMEKYGEALPVLEDAWIQSKKVNMPTFARLPIAAAKARSLMMLDRLDDAHQVVQEVAAVAQILEDTLGEAAGLAVSALREVQGVLEFRHGRISNARAILAGGSRLARVAGQPSQTVSVLTALADAELSGGDRPAAHNALAEARDIAQEEQVYPQVLKRLEEAETRLGRSAVRTAHEKRDLHEQLTDREMSILRALQGPLSQREIGRELFLSVNTVKGYTKSLYRKLAVVSRREAVDRGRQLGLI